MIGQLTSLGKGHSHKASRVRLSRIVAEMRQSAGSRQLKTRAIQPRQPTIRRNQADNAAAPGDADIKSLVAGELAYARCKGNGRKSNLSALTACTAGCQKHLFRFAFC
jgi:hypothetical protein